MDGRWEGRVGAGGGAEEESGEGRALRGGWVGKVGNSSECQCKNEL